MFLEVSESLLLKVWHSLTKHVYRYSKFGCYFQFIPHCFLLLPNGNIGGFVSVGIFFEDCGRQIVCVHVEKKRIQD